MNIDFINNIERLYKQTRLEKYKKYFVMYSEDITSDQVSEILPDHVLENYKKDLNTQISEVENIDSLNYLDRLEKSLSINGKLDNSFIDYKVYNFLIMKETNETLKSTLKSFKGERVVNYNFTNTTTGRLTTKSNSPNILTLPKRYRNIFTSKWKSEGSLLMVDFSSLEPRIAKKLTSKENYIDIYEEINNLTEDNLDRSVIKRAVISTLYGSSTSLDNISKEKTENLTRICKEFFDYKSLIDLSKPVTENGYRTNYFGRPLWNAGEHRENIIVNNYIQSTAVDVSLSCFYEMIQNIKTDLCRPIFIIHDAIVFDVHNDEKENFVNYVEQGYNCKKLGHFPLECTDFMETTK